MIYCPNPMNVLYYLHSDLGEPRSMEISTRDPPGISPIFVNLMGVLP